MKISDLDGDIGEKLSELINSMDLILLEEQKEEYQIWVDGGHLSVPNLGINIVSGIGCVYQEESKEYEADSDFFIFYDTKGRELYFEGGSSLNVCIQNYCSQTGQSKSYEEVDNLNCCYVVDGGDFIKSKVLDGISFEVKGEIDY